MAQITMNGEYVDTAGKLATRLGLIENELAAISRCLENAETPRNIRQHLKAKRITLKVEYTHLSKKRARGQS